MLSIIHYRKLESLCNKDLVVAIYDIFTLLNYIRFSGSQILKLSNKAHNFYLVVDNFI